MYWLYSYTVIIVSILTENLRWEEYGEYDDVQDDGDQVDGQADQHLLQPILQRAHIPIQAQQ